MNTAIPGVDLPLPRPRADLGTPSGCARTLGEYGWRDVAVHTLTHDLVVPDPPAFFRSLSEWSAPTRAITDLLDADGMDRAADAFADIVARSAPSGDRVPFSALVSIGAPA